MDESDGRCVRCGGSRQRRSPYVSGPRTARHRQEPGAGPDRRVGERRGAGAGETSRRLACRLRAVDERYGTTNRHAAHAFHHAIRHHDAGQPFDRSRSVHAGAVSRWTSRNTTATRRSNTSRTENSKSATRTGCWAGIRRLKTGHTGRRIRARAGHTAPPVLLGATAAARISGAEQLLNYAFSSFKDYASAPASGHRSSRARPGRVPSTLAEHDFASRCTNNASATSSTPDPDRSRISPSRCRMGYTRARQHGRVDQRRPPTVSGEVFAPAAGSAARYIRARSRSRRRQSTRRRQRRYLPCTVRP